MCFPITCTTCGLTTWGGDGRHIDTVMRSVPEGDACRCTHARRKARLQASCVLEQLCAPMQMAQPHVHATSAGAVCAGSLSTEEPTHNDRASPLGAGGSSVRDCGLARLRESLRSSLREAAPAAVGAGGAPERNGLAPGSRGGQLLVGLAGLRSALSHSSINRPTSLPARSFGGSIGDAAPPALGNRGRAAGPLSAELPPRSATTLAATAALAATTQQQHLAPHQGNVVRMRASLSTGVSAEAMSMVLGQGTCDAQVKIVGKASKQASICSQQC